METVITVLERSKVEVQAKSIQTCVSRQSAEQNSMSRRHISECSFARWCVCLSDMKVAVVVVVKVERTHARCSRERTLNSKQQGQTKPAAIVLSAMNLPERAASQL